MELKKRIMRRVYAIWFVRKAAPVALEVGGIFVLGLWGLKYISPLSVLANALAAADGITAFLIFFQRAFYNLSAPSQFALVAGALLSALILRDVWMQTQRMVTLRQKMLLS